MRMKEEMKLEERRNGVIKPFQQCRCLDVTTEAADLLTLCFHHVFLMLGMYFI